MRSRPLARTSLPSARTVPALLAVARPLHAHRLVGCEAVRHIVSKFRSASRRPMGHFPRSRLLRILPRHVHRHRRRPKRTRIARHCVLRLVRGTQQTVCRSSCRRRDRTLRCPRPSRRGHGGALEQEAGRFAQTRGALRPRRRPETGVGPSEAVPSLPPPHSTMSEALERAIRPHSSSCLTTDHYVRRSSTPCTGQRPRPQPRTERRYSVLLRGHAGGSASLMWWIYTGTIRGAVPGSTH